MPQLLIVADDLTGAADTGACFAARGLATVIPLKDTATREADVVVISTESRDLDGEEARRIVAAAVADFLSAPRGDGPRWIYKKIDSALRGNPREELLAAMVASAENRALIAPAFPAEGRTTIGGRQFVKGRPLTQSPFGAESATFDIAALFASEDAPPIRVLVLTTIRDQQEDIAGLLDREPAGVFVADAATEEDLLALARVTSRTTMRLLCGTAGFARALAQTLPLRPASPSAHGPGPGAVPVLVVAGSQNEVTQRQVAHLAEVGIPVVRPSQGAIEGAESLDGAVREVEAYLSDGRATALTTAGLAAAQQGGRAVAERLAQIVASPRLRRSIGGLVLTGGDVAAAVLAALDASAFWLGGEIAPGQPWGVLEGGVLPDLPVATKAGSFGDDRALMRCVAYLAAGETGPRQ